MAEQANVELTSWNRFHTRNLAVAPELLGQSHLFTFNEHRVSISLPSAEWLPDNEPQPTGTFVGKRVGVSSWHTAQDGRQKVSEVLVDNVDVAVSIPGRTTIPQKALRRCLRVASVVKALCPGPMPGGLRRPTSTFPIPRYGTCCIRQATHDGP